MISVKEYIAQKFQSFGITISEAELLDIAFSSGLSMEDEVTANNYNKVAVAVVKFVPTLLLRAQSISENGFSMSWDLEALKTYYSCKCKEYGLEDKINTNKPEVTFL